MELNLARSYGVLNSKMKFANEKNTISVTSGGFGIKGHSTKTKKTIREKEYLVQQLVVQEHIQLISTAIDQ